MFIKELIVLILCFKKLKNLLHTMISTLIIPLWLNNHQISLKDAKNLKINFSNFQEFSLTFYGSTNCYHFLQKNLHRNSQKYFLKFHRIFSAWSLFLVQIKKKKLEKKNTINTYLSLRINIFGLLNFPLFFK